MPPDLSLWLTLISSNYPCLERISMVPKVFEAWKFYWISIYLNYVSQVLMPWDPPYYTSIGRQEMWVEECKCSKISYRSSFKKKENVISEFFFFYMKSFDRIETAHNIGSLLYSAPDKKVKQGNSRDNFPYFSINWPYFFFLFWQTCNCGVMSLSRKLKHNFVY